jgi:type IV secretion system protein VirB2
MVNEEIPMSNVAVPTSPPVNGDVKIPPSILDIPEDKQVVGEPPRDDDDFRSRPSDELKSLATVAMVVAGIFALSLVTADPAHAQAFGRIETILNNIISAITGGVGKAIAIIAVMMVGLAWMFGQMDVKRAGAVIVGIGIVWGAAQIVGTMVG